MWTTDWCDASRSIRRQRRSSVAARTATFVSCLRMVRVTEEHDASGKMTWKSPDSKKHEFEVSRVYCLNKSSYFSGDQEGGLKVHGMSGCLRSCGILTRSTFRARVSSTTKTTFRRSPTMSRRSVWWLRAPMAHCR